MKNEVESVNKVQMPECPDKKNSEAVASQSDEHNELAVQVLEQQVLSVETLKEDVALAVEKETWTVSLSEEDREVLDQLKKDFENTYFEFVDEEKHKLSMNFLQKEANFVLDSIKNCMKNLFAESSEQEERALIEEIKKYIGEQREVFSLGLEEFRRTVSTRLAELQIYEETEFRKEFSLPEGASDVQITSTSLDEGFNVYVKENNLVLFRGPAKLQAPVRESFSISFSTSSDLELAKKYCDTKQIPLLKKMEEKFNSETRKEEITLELRVMKKPEDLWERKDVISDFLYSYKKSDDSCLMQDVAETKKTIIGASTKGRSHWHTGKPRDDHFAVDVQNDWILLAVADGAGSAEYSCKGSEIACNVGIETFTEILKVHGKALENKLKNNEKELVKDKFAEFFRAITYNAYMAIKAEAEKQKKEIRDYATTALYCAAKKIDGLWYIASFWIGDGAIAVYKSDAEVLLLGTPDEGEYSGQTRFLTMTKEIDTLEKIARRTTVVDFEDFKALVLMTDGVSDPCFETEANLCSATKWNDFWELLDSHVDFEKRDSTTEQSLVKWCDTYYTKGNHDDRTIVVLY